MTKVTIVLALAAVTASTALADVPLFGSRNYYPSADRPIGYRGDGRGYYPGATPVREFHEGTPVEKQVEFYGKAGIEKKKVWEVADTGAKNIVWRTRLSSWAHSQPIIVGDKAFTTGDPNILYCVDMNSGKVLWERRTSRFEAMGVDPEEAKLLDSYVAQVHAAFSVNYARVGAYNRLPDPWKAVYAEPIARELAVARKIFVRLIEEHPYGEKAKPFLERYDAAVAAVAQLKEGDKSNDKREVAGRKTRLGREILSPIADAKSWIEKEYKLNLFPGWGIEIGSAYSTPVSDGRTVYVCHLGQVAAYDLSGNRRWIAWVPHYDHKAKLEVVRGMQKKARPGGIRANHVPSPRLAGDVLIVQAPDQLAGLDKATGKVLWKRPELNVGGGYNVGSHAVVKLPGGRRLVVTTHDEVLDAKTGETVCDLEGARNRGGESGGASLIYHDNRVYFDAGGRDSKVTGFVGFKLGEDADGNVTCKRILTIDKKYSDTVNITGMLAGDHLYRPSKGDYVYHIPTGEVGAITGQGRRFWLRHGARYTSGALIGEVYFWHKGLDGRQGRVDLRCPLVVWTVPLSEPGKLDPKAVTESNVLNESPWPEDWRYRRYGPEVYKELDKKARWPVENNAKKGGWHHAFLYKGGCIPSTAGYGGYCATGNRVVLRTISSLVCIGDPSVPYDWNPASKK